MMLMKQVIKSVFTLSIIFSCFSCLKEEHPICACHTTTS